MNRRSFFSTITGVLCAPLAVFAANPNPKTARMVIGFRTDETTGLRVPETVQIAPVPISEVIHITSKIDADVDYNLERMAKYPKQPRDVDPHLIDSLRAMAKDSSRPTSERVMALRVLCFIYSR